MGCRLDGKAVVVTGAGRGIGEASARLAARLGAKVLVNDVDAGAAARVARTIAAEDGVAEAAADDVSDWGAGRRLVDACLDRFGRLDGFVNNAGLFRIGPMAEASEKDFRDLLAVNLLGTAAGTQAAAAHMVGQGQGAIVNITSGAQCGMIGLGPYGATKGAVASLTYAWALELEGSGVRLNAVSPMADTRMAEHTRAYLAAAGVDVPGTIPAPAASAPAICYLLSDRAAAIHGQVVRTDGRLLALMTHPAILSPALEREAWTTESVAEAFDGALAGRRQALGLVRVAQVQPG